MAGDSSRQGARELRGMLRRVRGPLGMVAVFSLAMNLLLLAPPLYMLQVYDRVLVSQSTETLVSLTVLLAFAFAVMALLDACRARIANRVGIAFQDALDARLFEAQLRVMALKPDDVTAGSFRDLEAVRRCLSSALLIAVFDLPWMPIFFIVIYIFHPLLGALALGGAALLVVLAVLHHLASRMVAGDGMARERAAQIIAAQAQAGAESIIAMSMQRGVLATWQDMRLRALQGGLAQEDLGERFRATSRAARLFLQSAMLGLGAWLVIGSEMSAGGMLAGSILLGRALMPIEALLAQWRHIGAGVQGWRNLVHLLGRAPPRPPQMALPAPVAHLSVRGATVQAPGTRRSVLRGMSFDLEPGQGLGVIGPSGAGKTALARALTGAWPAAVGTIRLGNVDIAQATAAGQWIGYLPQRVDLFDGTVAQNIARFDPDRDDQQVIDAAKLAASHEMILTLPKGYDTPVQQGRAALSGGQLQRIGLARALYGNPLLLILDEPNANLDSEGSKALNDAIRQIKARAGAVVVMAHRPAAIQECEVLMMLDKGSVSAFGPKGEVLQNMVRNAKDLGLATVEKGAA